MPSTTEYRKGCRCRGCTNLIKRYMKTYRDRNRVRYKSYRSEERARRDKRLAVLKGSGCQDCGFTGHPSVLEFDHLKKKSFNVSTVRHRIAWSVLMKEIEKCEVVCANCHSLRTWKRTKRGGKGPVARLRAKRRACIDAIKLRRGCSDCGYKKHQAPLQFDHLRDKVFPIARGLDRPWKVIEAEIDKCEVVCANCHRLRTLHRRSG